MEKSMQNQIDHSAVKAILNVLRRKIARRTSEEKASSMLSRFIQELTPKYEFLQYITINQKVYSETEKIQVSPELNKISEQKVYAALHEMVRKSVQEMKEKADFFFIREFQDAFEDIDEVRKKISEDIPLNEMQHEYLVNRTQALSLEKNHLLINMIHILLSISNTYLPERQSVELINETLTELLPKYPFFHAIDIVKNTETKGYYTVKITEDVQKISMFQFADALYELIILVGTKLNLENPEEFKHRLKRKLGEKNIELLRKMNVSIENLPIVSQKITKKDILKKLIDSLIIIIGERTSEYFAVAVMIKMLDSTKKKYSLLNNVQLQKTGKDYQLSFSDDFKNVNEEEFRKTLKSLIQAVGAHLGRKRKDFIEELKKKLGNEHVSSIENIGLNFHILEMKYN